MERQKKPEVTPLSEQVKNHIKSERKQKAEEQDGNFEKTISTGSTLLDLAISGTRVRGGGIPGGILVEAFGPNGSGKTVLLCETAGDIQRKGGQVKFDDPEARLNKTFAQIFDLDTEQILYSTPDTVTEIFTDARKWQPEGKKNVIHGIFTDSLAALSTQLEMEDDEGDKMGMKRAKEFSEQLRRTCRLIKQNNWIMMCSNQVRQNVDAGKYGRQTDAPGGKAMGFYSSLRLCFNTPEKIKKEVSFHGKKTDRIIGITTMIEVFKSSLDRPYRKAPVTILFDYGIDDVRQNLQFIKDFSKETTYTVNGMKLSNSMEEAIEMVEKRDLELELKEQVIDLWESIEAKFDSNRKHKER